MAKIYASQKEMIDDVFGDVVERSRPIAKRRDPKAAALYHEMRAEDGFDATATILFELVRQAIEQFPDKRRILYLDIDDHWDGDAFDDDAYEIQNSYVCGFLGQWLHEAHMPIVCWTNAKANDNIAEVRQARSN